MGVTREKIVIVGGGILGCALCWRLAEAGFNVTLLERHSPASGASGGNLSQISIVDRLESWHMTVTLNTLAHYAQLKESHQLDFHQSGGLTVLRNPAEMEAAEKAAATLQTYGVPGRVITDWAEIEKLEPELNQEAAIGVLYCPHEGKVDAFSATLLLARLARAAGASILQNTGATGFTMQGETIRQVNTDEGNFPADIVINAAGPWSPHIASLAGQVLPISWHRGTALVSRPMPTMINCTIVGGGFLLAEAAGASAKNGLRIGLGMLQNAHGSIFLSQATTEDPSDDREVELQSMVLVARQALSYFPRLQNLEILRAWSAPTTYTQDGSPFFGFASVASNLFSCAGFKGAFSTALGVADEAVKTLIGQPTLIGSFAAPNRQLIGGGQSRILS